MAPLNEESVQEIAAEGQEVELTPEQKKEQLGKLMADGKRELRAANLEAAAEKFGEAAEFAAKHYGPLAAESFEPNFLYGRTLVEVSAMENEVLTTALTNMVKKKVEESEEKDGNESMTEEEKEDVRELVADALAENAEELEKRETEGTEEESKEGKTDENAKGDGADEETVEEKTEEESKEEKTGEETTDEIAEGTGKEEQEEAAENEDDAMDDGEAAVKEDIEDGDSEDEEEDADINEIAWEALEVASKIADKMIEETSSAEWKKNKADVFVQLAQCTTNEEKYDLALEDLGRAHNLMAEIATAKGDRLTAEVGKGMWKIYFHEGRIHRLCNAFTLAEESFNKGASAMETFLEGLKTEAGSTPTDVQKEEMEDLVQVIKDFRERAEDCKGSAVQKQEVTEMAEKEKAEAPSILTTSNANSDPTANDISSLVRKKRAAEPDAEEAAPKKSKSEEVEMGDSENVPVV